MAEFKFFDLKYFENYSVATINYYYSGHGEVSHIKLLDFDLEYKEVV